MDAPPPLPIPPRAPDTVPVLNATAFHAFTLSWQLAPPQDALIVIVKGTFDLAHRAPATVAEEQLLPTDEEPFADAQTPEAVRYPGDTAFFKPKADLFLTGRAHAPPGSRHTALVRLALGRAVDHAVAVVGERRWSNGVPSQPAPFDSIELRPERAFGGPGFAANPIGRGHEAVDGAPLPNLERPDALVTSPRDRPAPALTTPIAKGWRPRADRVGSYGGDWAKKRAPYFPPDFDWSFFNAAPPELQIPYPSGDEPYWIKGMDPGHALIEGRLPGLRVRALAQPVDAPGELREIRLNLDTVWFDTEARKLVLAWRGALPTADMYGSDLGAILVRADPLEQRLDLAAHHRLFSAIYERDYGPPPEVPDDEEDAAEEPKAAPEGYVPPKGLTPTRARQLGLPPWAATLREEAPEADAEPTMPEPPPPAARLTRAEVEALVGSDESLAEQDLTGCDLSGLDLSGRALDGALLMRVDLRGATLAGASLRGAVLSEVNAEGLDFTGADLSGADLTDAIVSGATFAEATLEDAVLDGARAIGARLEGARLARLSAHRADFSLARFDGADLAEADLTGAALQEASLVGCAMVDVRLYEVRGRGLVADDAEMERCRADRAELPGASLQRVKAADSSFRETDLREADFRKAKLEGTVFDDANLERALFSQVEAKECRWPRARAAGASFLKANLMAGHFESARFQGADLRGANLYDANTFQASFRGADLTHAILGNSGLG